MTTAAQAGRPAFGPLIVPLLALAIFINYVDRGNLATAAPLMMGELGLDATQIGILISAFFWAYTPGLVLAGWLADRFNAYMTLAVGLAIWSLATLLTGLAGSIAVRLARSDSRWSLRSSVPVRRTPDRSGRPKRWSSAGCGTCAPGTRR